MKTNSMKTETLIIKYNLPLKLEEVPFFRGAMVAAAGLNASILMHDHDRNDGLRYAYPLIQYKVIDGKAAVMCINQGIEDSGNLMSACNKKIHIGARHELLQVASIQPNIADFSIEGVTRYAISNWLPFNQDNLLIYQGLTTKEEKIAHLEKILIGNILSCAKGLGISINDMIQVEIVKLEPPTLVECKHVKMMSFDAEFITNVRIPENIGLGKHASFGYGQISEIKNHNI